MGVVVHIDRFSGPMALLLHLIRQEEMDIFDINIHEITKQYLDSIKSMKKLNLEVAGDFIAMAATLIQIKSKMLLPQYNEEGEIVEEADPRRDLVRRLLEYQMYQEAGHSLYKRPLLGRDIWGRGSREELNVKDDSIVIEEENALYSLISMYRAAIKKMTKAVHRVAESLQSIADRVRELRERLIVGQTTTLSSLLENPNQMAIAGGGALVASPDAVRGRLLITFLSLLELAKMGLVNLFQSDNFAEIHVETKAEISAEAISQVENYDSQTTAATQSAEIWLDETDRQEIATAEAAGAESTQGSLFANAENYSKAPKADEQPEVQAATDAEIEAELAELNQHAQKEHEA